MKLRTLIEMLEHIEDVSSGYDIDVEIIDEQGFAAPVKCLTNYVFSTCRATVRLEALAMDEEEQTDAE